MHSLHILALLLLFPSHATRQDQERRSVDVVLSVPKSEAFNRTMAAVISEGLVVDRADVNSGILATVPHVSGGALRIATVYRANIIAIGDTASRVILSGGYTSKDVGTLSRALSSPSLTQVLPDEQPLNSSMRRTLGDAWKVIERIAVALAPS